MEKDKRDITAVAGEDMNDNRETTVTSESVGKGNDEAKQKDDTANKEKKKKEVDPGKEAVKNTEEELKSPFMRAREETNFTWEHFFVTHCGILPEDALEYEAHLIAHRLSPEDSLLESLGLIVQYGKIPIGDKFKIVKTLKRKQESNKSHEEHKKEARKLLGLEEFNEFEASVILDLAGGTTEYHIDWGIEQWEDCKREMEKVCALHTTKGGTGFLDGASLARQFCSPERKLLYSFGYRTFDYTRGKTVAKGAPQQRCASADPLTNSDVLFGNAEDHTVSESAMGMYS